MDENEELNALVNRYLAAWRQDVDSVEIPILVTDEQAVEIIKAGIGRPGVARRIMQWIFSR